MMKQDKNKIRRVGGLMLEALMLFFIFTSTFTEVKANHQKPDDVLTISAAPVEQLVFRDTNASESLVQTLVEAQFSDCEFIPFTFDLLSLQIQNIETFLVSRSVFHPFYYHITTKAP